jgi:hypothetical protein
MTTELQIEANRRNALQSTGPKTENGIEVARFNALRHGLRSLQTVVPGEALEEWEAHRAAIVIDLKHEGPVELALAEQIAAKLWRLGRVVRYEADLITIGQSKDELLHSHEKVVTHPGSLLYCLDRTDIPNFEDVKAARKSVAWAEEKAQKWKTALRVLETLHEFKDSNVFDKEEWPLYDALKEDLRLEKQHTDKLFKGDNEDFAVHHARTMLQIRGSLEEVTKWVVAYWRDKKVPELEQKVTKAKKILKNVLRRYQGALERLRQSGCPMRPPSQRSHATRPT